MGETKICNSGELAILMGEAIRKKYNRQGEPVTILPRLDPDGLHVVTRWLGFHNEQDHHRCEVMAKAIDTMVPMTFWLDIEYGSWDRLVDAEEAVAAARSLQEEEV